MTGATGSYSVLGSTHTPARKITPLFLATISHSRSQFFLGFGPVPERHGAEEGISNETFKRIMKLSFCFFQKSAVCVSKNYKYFLLLL